MAIDLGPLRRHQAFRRLFVGQTISTFGSEIAAVAAPFQLYELTHSTLQVGLLSVCELVPLLTLTIVGGAIADAIDRRRLLLWTEALLARRQRRPRAQCLARPAARVGAVRAGDALDVHLLVRRRRDDHGDSAPGRARGARRRERDRERLLEHDLGRRARTRRPPDRAARDHRARTCSTPGRSPPRCGRSGCCRSFAPAPDADRPSVRSIVEGFRFVVSKKVLLGMFLTDSNAMVFGMPQGALSRARQEVRRRRRASSALIYAAPYAGALARVAALGLDRARTPAGARGGPRRRAAGASSSSPSGSPTRCGSRCSSWPAAGAADNVSAVMRQTILFSVTPDRMRGRVSGIEFAQVASSPALGNLEAGVVASLDEPALLDRRRAGFCASSGRW